MNCSTRTLDNPSLLELLRSGGWWSGYCDAMRQLNEAVDDAGAIRALRLAAWAFGASGAMFSHVVQHDASLSVLRTLVACDTPWANAYAAEGWFEDDPWLRHAAQQTTTVQASDIATDGPRQQAVVDALRAHGFASAIVVPAPSNVGRSRIGMLCIGSTQSDYFAGAAFELLRPLVRGLAMELGDWWMRQLRAGLVARAHVTADDLKLLRHEAQGHSSKTIARSMGAQMAAIDSRFQRLNRRLGVACRRDAMRLGRLYGLI